MPEFLCGCGTLLSYSDNHAGKQVRCPQCLSTVQAPFAEPAKPERISDQVQSTDKWSTMPSLPSFDPQEHTSKVTATSKKAVVAFALGISSVFFFLFTAIPAIIVGMLAIRDCNRDWRLTGRSFAGFGILAGFLGPIVNLLLFVFVVPPILSAREASLRATDHDHMKTISNAMHQFHDTHKKFPNAWYDGGPKREKSHSAFYYLLPFIGHGELHQMPEALPMGESMPGIATIPIFLSPLDPQISANQEAPGQICYALNIRAYGPAQIGKKLAPSGTADFEAQQITDGISNTFMLATKRSKLLRAKLDEKIVWWNLTLFDGLLPWQRCSPYFGAGEHEDPASEEFRTNLTFHIAPPENAVGDGSIYGHAFQKKGMSVALFDGSVRFVSASITPRVFQAGLGRDDGLPFQLD